MNTQCKKERYNRYIRSANWKFKRIKTFKRYGKKCAKCGSTENIQVHHLTYKRVGRENVNDIIPLCEKCHAKFHLK